MLFAQLSDRVSLVRNDLPEVNNDELDRLRLTGVAIETRPARAIYASGDGLEIILDGATVEADVVAPRFEPNAAMLEGLVTIADHVSGMGRRVVVDAFGRTSHPKIYAVGNVADPMQQVLHTLQPTVLGWPPWSTADPED